MTDINSLPDEILVRIFEFYVQTTYQCDLLNCLSKVCRKWEELSKESSNFRSVDGSISITKIVSLAKSGSLMKTKSLKFGKIPKAKHKRGGKRKCIFDEHLKNFYANLPCLKSLNLGNVSSDLSNKKQHPIFTELKDFCPDLCELIFGDPEINCEARISHTIFDEFLCARGPKLVTLDFSRVYVHSFRKVFATIAKNCPNLENLMLQDMPFPSSSDVIFPIEQMQVGCPKLKTLRLSKPFMFNEKLNPKAPGFPHLEIFTYPYRDEMHTGDDSFLMLLDKSPNLQILDVRGSRRISVEAVHSLVANDLEQLYLSHSKITHQKEMVILLQKWNHSLRVIDLSFTTSDFLDEILGPSWMPNGFPELESLDVNSSAAGIHMLKHVIQHSPKLSFLNVQLCRCLGRKMRHVYRSRNEIEELLKIEEIDLA